MVNVETVNALTMEHGRQFAQRWADGGIKDAFEATEVLKWPEKHRDAQNRFFAVQEDICERVFDALKEQIAETFVRVANAAIDAERRPTQETLTPPRIATVAVVTVEHAETLIDVINEKLIDSGAFIEGFSEAAIMTWPDDDEAAQEHYNQLADEIRDGLFAETRPVIAAAFVRIANAVVEEERARPEEPLVPPRIEMVETVTPEHGLIFAEQIYRETADSEIFDIALSATHIRTFPDGPDGEETAAQKHFHDMTDEIRDRIHEETKQLIADAFVRVVGDVFSRERQRR
jgi:5-carboxymethyl-2-hydroxymuconate isomerase